MAFQDFTLLVVDDEETNRDLLARRLGRLGYRVLVAESGPVAIEIVRKEPVDLVLLDVMMSDMDGLEVLTLLRENYSITDLPVVMVTARDQSGDVVAAMQLGANDYVTKPINFPIIFARIQTHLAIKEATRAKIAAEREAASKYRSQVPTPKFGASDTSELDIPSWMCVENDRARVGDYVLLGELGRGGMGVVYKARHMRMNRLVALKVIDKEHLLNPEAVQRFYREIQAAAQLHHPNVVLAYDAGQVGDTHYFAMEYVEGCDLARMVAKSGPLPILQACDYVRQAAVGLSHAASRGMVHRDIKPSNLFVQTGVVTEQHKYGLLKILDMGLALLHQPTESTGAAGQLTKEGHVMGSVDYMAPEQWMNPHKVDVRADLYSLGCTLYYLISGTVPFGGEQPMEKMLKHHLDEARSLKELRPETPSLVAKVVRRLMQKRPEERIQTPEELAEALSYCLVLGARSPSVAMK